MYWIDRKQNYFSKLNLKDVHKSEYKGNRIDEKSKEILKDFYKPFNEKLFRLIGKKYLYQL